MGGAAKMTSVFWAGVAEAVQPEREPATPADRAAPEPVEEDSRPDHPTDSSNEPEPREGESILVPLDAWTRVLEQLGNLHQAGQDLAAARERAARAETEVQFLKEQLAEAKKAAKPAPEPRAPRPAPSPEAPKASSPAGSGTIDLRGPRARVVRARNRVSGWISVG